MSNLLVIYGLSIIASAVFASGLAAIGSHIAHRNQAMQTLCLSQGALLGVLLGIGVSYAADLSNILSGILPLISGNLVGALTVYLCSVMTMRRPASKGTLFVAIFALLLALSHLASALFPGLESHMTQRYFGDLATLSNNAAKALLIGGGLLLLYLYRIMPQLMRTSFDDALTGDGMPTSVGRLKVDSFTWLTIVVVAVSVQLTGLLFTTVCLFLPTTCVAFSQKPGARRHIIWSMVIAFVGSAAGFLTALAASSLPTVPTIAVVMIVVGALSIPFFG